MIERSRKHLLLERAERAEEIAFRSQHPSVQETMRSLAALYRDLARQVDTLAELKESAGSPSW
jgi:hypothetical protein